MLTRRSLIGGLATVSLCGPAQARAAARRVQGWATRSGGETLDGAGGSGNPFATAFIETMSGPALDLGAFAATVSLRTRALSNDYQAPEFTGLTPALDWRIGARVRERRRALVLVFENYSASDAAPSLPGAGTDGARMHRALTAAGFQTAFAKDVTRDAMPGLLDGFSRASASADAAVIYATGHGVEVDGVQYALYGDHRVGDGVAGLQRALRWTDVARAAQGRRVNLTMWAGCRNNPFVVAHG